MIQKLKGTIDILPEEMPIWRMIEDKARKNAAKYGFAEIRTPILESTELFARGVGEATDVVTKEMYTFSDREARSLTMRPEGTAAIARALIENGRCSDAMPVKYFYIYNCFRHEKPQAGRLREFWQFGVESFGANTPEADADAIAVANSFLCDVGLKNVSLRINSIGCPECRTTYRKALREYFSSHEEELCETCRKRLEINPLRVLDCKSPICSALAKDAPKTLEYLCDGCKKHMDRTLALLDGFAIPYTVDTSIVRGLDYYTKTVFEFTSGDIGAQSAVGGGGRYDGLVKELGGPDLSGVGFAIGINRVILALKAQNFDAIETSVPDLYIAPMGENASTKAAILAENLRRTGFAAESDIVGRSLKAQMKYADKKKARFTLIVGDNEIESGKAIIKNMSDSSQSEVALCSEAIAEIIKK